jgi:hypothetical protein
MDSLENDHAAGLLDGRAPPCMSLYQPTHRHHPENQQDPIRFRNLVKQLEESLRQKYARHEIGPLVEPFSALTRNAEFWNHTLDGLAVLAAPGLFRVYRLQRPVPELAIAADSFHMKPLMRILQSADRYQILGVTRQRIALYEGNRDVLDEVELAPDVPRTLTDALGEELTEPRLTVSSYGGAGRTAMHHGHGGRKDQIDLDAERFFRAVDREVLERHSRPSKLPLFLAALPENQSTFRSVSRNPFLAADGIDSNPEALSLDELRGLAWQVVEPHYVARLLSIVDKFEQSRGKGLGTDDAAQAAEAAVAGRVETLLVEAARQLPGRIDAATGAVQFDDLAHPEIDDVLDDLAALVTRQGGEVIVVPAERMPTDTGLAAVYRY